MPDFSPSPLSEFNRQVLLFQDEAFTLACHLTGDENAAADITQRAFLCVYQHQTSSNDASIRLPLLRCIIHKSSHYPVPLNSKSVTLLEGLPEPECLVPFLVDCLGLTYADASHVLHCSSRNLAVRLAQARRKFAGCDRIKSRELHDENSNPGG